MDKWARKSLPVLASTGAYVIGKNSPVPGSSKVIEAANKFVSAGKRFTESASRSCQVPPDVKREIIEKMSGKSEEFNQYYKGSKLFIF